MSDGTKSRTCGEHEDFNNGTETIDVVGFLQSLSKQELINMGVLEHKEWLLKQVIRREICDETLNKAKRWQPELNRVSQRA